ncbi:MAG TPA: hypothetical protein VFI15_10820 [Candidatus Limnocylindrales bacterium]|nr:hypothetical protein [Candidatus Limnocylindrales bacterium]
MTTPFRRRHHDDESAHDRARALTATEMLEPLDEIQTVWLAGHLEGCAECRNDREAYLADRALLRSLRDATPEPPRDLRARTMAALDRESLARSKRGRAAGRTAGRPLSSHRRPQLPFGAAAGALIVLVVVGATFLPQLVPNRGPESTPGGSDFAFGSPDLQATAFPVPAVDDVGWVQPGLDGHWELVLADVTSLCPRTRPSCQPLGEDQPSRIVELGSKPHGVTISPTETQLVVETQGQGSAPGKIFVVSLPPEPDSPTPAPTDSTVAPTTTPGETAAPTVVPPTVVPPTAAPGTAEPPTAEPSQVAISPLPTTDVPRGAVEIASGVTVVGETLYSPDGAWLAFSARPSDGSRGPDLYLWHVGEPTAIAVTDDHATYFSTWLDGRILASRVEPVVLVADPGTSPGVADATPEASPATSADATPEASPATTADATGGPTNVGHPMSFLLDPATLTRATIEQPDVWLPVVDPSGKFAAFWSGTVSRATEVDDWQPAEGSLVLSPWSDGTTAAPTSPAPTDDATASPDESPAAAPALGPVGNHTELVPGPVAAFRTNFDPTGSRLAVWVGDTIDGDVGRLHLVVLDPSTGGVDESVAPLPGVPALRRFSIDRGRLAWVTPSGQDGQDSSVQVLGWSGNEFGEMHGIPAKQMYLVR